MSKRVKKTLLDFSVSISDIKPVNPLFSTCKVKVMYTGVNRNKSTISRQAVEKALPTLANIPIVGEFSVENQDFKGHGGSIDLSDYRYIHTTKPYGVVPESATIDWVNDKDPYGNPHEYLVVNGCYLWTGRYEEAESVINNGKGQSMEIEVVDGEFDKLQDSYIIKDFIFSALCILGDTTEPAFEGANITAYSLDKDSFKREFSLMLKELKSISNKEGNNMEKLKQLLQQYSVSMEEVTASGIVFEGLSEDQLEVKFVETFGNKGAKNKNQKQVASGLDSDNSENAPKGSVQKDPNEQYKKMMGNGDNTPNNGDVPDAQDPKDGAKEDNKDKNFDLTPEQMTAMAKKSANVSAPEKSAVGNPDNLELEPVIQDKNNDTKTSLKGDYLVEDQGNKAFDVKDEEDATVKYNEDPTQVEPEKPAKKNKDVKDSQKGDYIDIEKDASFADDPDKDGDDDSSKSGDNDNDANGKDLKKKYELLLAEVEELRAFKLEVEKTDKTAKAEKLFKDFQLNEQDVEGIDIHAFSLEQLEEKCYAILGRKMVSKKNFSKESNKGIHLPVNNIGSENNEHSRYGNLFNK